MNKYYDWDSFKDVYLEDSFVLDIDEIGNKICFTVDIVLSENHPLYLPPKKNEEYCYKKGKIIFQNVISSTWLKRNKHAITDANNEIDYGNIDIFERIEEGYYLTGDWGQVIIDSWAPEIVW